MEKYFQKLHELIAKAELTPSEVKDGMLSIYVVISRLNQTQGNSEMGLKQEADSLYAHISGFMGAIFWERGFDFENPTLEQIAEVKIMVDGMTQIYAMPDNLQNVLNDVYDTIVGYAKGLAGQISTETKALLNLGETPASEITADQPSEEPQPPVYGQDHEIASILSEIPSDTQSTWDDELPPHAPVQPMPEESAGAPEEAQADASVPEAGQDGDSTAQTFDPSKVLEEDDPVSASTSVTSEEAVPAMQIKPEEPISESGDFDPSSVLEEEVPVPVSMDTAPEETAKIEESQSDSSDFDPSRIVEEQAPLPEIPADSQVEELVQEIDAPIDAPHTHEDAPPAPEVPLEQVGDEKKAWPYEVISPEKQQEDPEPKKTKVRKTKKKAVKKTVKKADPKKSG